MRTIFTTAAIATAIAGIAVAATPAAAQPYRHDHRHGGGWHHGYDRPHHDRRWQHRDWHPHHLDHGYYGRHR